MTFPGNFSHFFKILVFWVVSGLKGQQMAQNGAIVIACCN